MKHCKMNVTSKVAEWTKTNFSLCLLPSEDTLDDVEETIKIETTLLSDLPKAQKLAQPMLCQLTGLHHTRPVNQLRD